MCLIFQLSKAHNDNSTWHSKEKCATTAENQLMFSDVQTVTVQFRSSSMARRDRTKASLTHTWLCGCVSAEFAVACVNPIMQLIFNHLDVVQIIFYDADQVTQTLLLLLQVLKNNILMLHKNNGRAHTHAQIKYLACLISRSRSASTR